MNKAGDEPTADICESEAGDEAEPLPAVDEHIGGGVEMLLASLDGA